MSIEGLRHPFPLSRLRPAEADVEITAQEYRTHNQMTGSLRSAFRFRNAFEAVPFFWQTAWEHHAQDVRFFSRNVMISIVGVGMAEKDEWQKAFSQGLAQNSIPSLLTERAGIRLTFCVPSAQAEDALHQLHHILLSLS